MLTIGAHLSIAKGYQKMGETALALDANTMAFFTRNPRGGAARALDPQDVAAFNELARAHGFGKLVGHAAYTLNPAAKTEHLRDFARQMLAEDLARMDATPGNYYNLHPGSHVGQGVEAGVGHIAAMFNAVLTADMQTAVLLETMSGKGSEIGGSFEELRAILDRVERNRSVGICFDTCHTWDADYDLVDDLDGVLTHFDKVIGLDRLKAVHLNDSLNARGSRKDRHAGIGEGHIGLEAFGRIINHPALHKLPFILETPSGEEGWKREISLLRGMYRDV